MHKFVEKYISYPQGFIEYNKIEKLSTGKWNFIHKFSTGYPQVNFILCTRYPQVMHIKNRVIHKLSTDLSQTYPQAILF